MSARTTCFAGGAIRSGKTTGQILGFATFTLAECMDFDAAIAGQSIESCMRNVGWELIKVYRAFGAEAEFKRDVGTRIEVQLGGKTMRVWLFGAADARSRRRIQGATLKALCLDELALLPEDFVMQAWARLSVDGSKMWATYNPEGPHHYVKRKILDRAEDFDADPPLHFNLRDNPSNSEATIARYERSFTSHWYARMIEGQWAGATRAHLPRVVHRRLRPAGCLRRLARLGGLRRPGCDSVCPGARAGAAVGRVEGIPLRRPAGRRPDGGSTAGRADGLGSVTVSWGSRGYRGYQSGCGSSWTRVPRYRSSGCCGGKGCRCGTRTTM